MLEALRRDRRRYVDLGEAWYGQVGFWIGATYRLGAWARSLRTPLLRFPALFLYRLIKLPWSIFYNVAISTGTRIGPGFCLVHPSNIIIGKDVVIGEDCTLFHEVTIGTGVKLGVPKIGNTVQIFVGARLLGPITIGDNCKIGANCVITRNVPAGSVVIQAPNRVIPLATFARLVEPGEKKAGEPVPPAEAPSEH